VITTTRWTDPPTADRRPSPRQVWPRQQYDDFALPADIDVALNEATWCGLRLDVEQRRLALGFGVLTLPDSAGSAGHARVTIVLIDVRRLVAVHRDESDADKIIRALIAIILEQQQHDQD
jgi:hypothetical protein